jgi:hypothetical protein
MTKPPTAAYNTVNTFWGKPFQYKGQNLVLQTPGEVNAPGYQTFLFNVSDPNGRTILILGLK